MSLTLRFSVWLVITSTAVLLMLSALDYAKESRRLSAELQSESDRIIERLAGNLPEPLFNVDYAQVSLIMNSEIKDPAVDQILVSERQGNTSKVKSSLYRQADGSVSDKTVQFVAENLLTRSQKLMHGNQEIGKVELGMSRLPMRAKLHTLVLSIGIRMVVTNAAILAAVFIMMKTLILRPLNAASDLLNRAAEHVLSSSEQVSGASQSQAEGSSEQAASIEEASSSLEEMASMTKRNAENAQKANDLAKQARLTADKGTENMQEMNSAMSEIQKSSDDIAKIIKTIDEIAFQTNILALNAAVEAARAGEAGMGFAVVADEVRNLAQRSAHAAKEISAKIEGAISKTAQGVGVSKHVTEALDNIVAQIRQVDELVSEVAGASREQTQGISQINLAIGEMDKVTQSNAANAEESAAAAQELNAQAVTMKESVNGLLKLVGGKTAVEMPAAEVHHGEPAVYRSVRQKTPVFPIPESADPWMRQ